MEIKPSYVWFKKGIGFVTLTLYVQPGAKRTEIAGLYGDKLKIRLASPPIEGRANDALLHYIALLFHVPVRQVELKQGTKSRHKVVIVNGSKIEPENIISLNLKLSVE